MSEIAVAVPRTVPVTFDRPTRAADATSTRDAPPARRRGEHHLRG